MKSNIKIKDFNLFYELVKTASKFVEAARFNVDNSGITLYGKNEVARCEMDSDSISTETPVSFDIQDVKMFLKILTTVKDVHEGDFTTMKFYIDLPAVRFESKKIKTKFITCNKADLMDKWVSKKVTTELTSIFDFTTNNDIIRKVLNHSFIFKDPKQLRIYLHTDKTMEKNVLYATLGNNENNLNNEMTLKFGLITFGSLTKSDESGNQIDRTLTLDCDRLQAFQIMNANELKISLMDKNVLVTNTRMTGNNDSYFNLTMYNSLKKN